MRQEKVFGVLTTIADPTECARHLHSFCPNVLQDLIVIGDRKGPQSYSLLHAQFYALDEQQKLGFQLSQSLPENHYARKNLGFLVALQEGATVIYETDDDTMPTEDWVLRDETQIVRSLKGKKWANVFRQFSDDRIWPRGLPLDELNCEDQKGDVAQESKAPIQQGMIDLSPDVDAVWRLVFGHEVFFEPGESVMVEPGTWCPFNSQNTWWHKAAFPLMYLPSHCDFRATDIWRGFIAQRCLWELSSGVVFHGPDTIQHRNVHNLMSDFKSEVSGYLRNQEITDHLASLSLLSGESNVAENLILCYEKLCQERVFPAEELSLVRTWVEDLQSIASKPQQNKGVQKRVA